MPEVKEPNVPNTQPEEEFTGSQKIDIARQQAIEQYGQDAYRQEQAGAQNYIDKTVAAQQNQSLQEVSQPAPEAKPEVGLDPNWNPNNPQKLGPKGEKLPTNVLGMTATGWNKFGDPYWGQINDDPSFLNGVKNAFLDYFGGAVYRIFDAPVEAQKGLTEGITEQNKKDLATLNTPQGLAVNVQKAMSGQAAEAGQTALSAANVPGTIFGNAIHDWNNIPMGLHYLSRTVTEIIGGAGQVLGQAAYGVERGIGTAVGMANGLNVDEAWQSSRILYSTIFQGTLRDEFIRRYRAGENPAILALELQNPLAELGGQMILDPLNLFGVIGKGKQLAKAGEAAGELLKAGDKFEDVTKVWDAADDVMKVAPEIASNLRSRFAKAGDELVTLATDKGVMAHTAEGKANLVAQINHTVLASLIGAEKDPSKLREVIMAMAHIAASKEGDDISHSVAILMNSKARDVIFSKAGGTTAQVLADMLYDTTGKTTAIRAKGIDTILAEARKAEDPLVYLSDKLAPLVDNATKKMFPDIGTRLQYEKMIDKAVAEGKPIPRNLERFVNAPRLTETEIHIAEVERKIKSIQNPINKFFASVYMGLNPAYAFRNFVSNTVGIFVDDPTTLRYALLPGGWKEAEEGLRGWNAMNFLAAQGIGGPIGDSVKELQKAKKAGFWNFGTRWAGSIESGQAKAVSYNAFRKSMVRMYDKMFIDLDAELLKAGMSADDVKAIKGMGWTLKGDFFGAIESVAKGDRRTLQFLDPDVIKSLHQTGFFDPIQDIVRTSDNLDQAITKIKKLLADYMEQGELAKMDEPIFSEGSPYFKEWQDMVAAMDKDNIQKGYNDLLAFRILATEEARGKLQGALRSMSRMILNMADDPKTRTEVNAIMEYFENKYGDIIKAENIAAQKARTEVLAAVAEARKQKNSANVELLWDEFLRMGGTRDTVHVESREEVFKLMEDTGKKLKKYMKVDDTTEWDEAMRSADFARGLDKADEQRFLREHKIFVGKEKKAVDLASQGKVRPVTKEKRFKSGEVRPVTTVNELISQIKATSANLSDDQVRTIGGLVEGMANYLGMDPDAYVKMRFAGVGFKGEPPSTALFKAMADFKVAKKVGGLRETSADPNIAAALAQKWDEVTVDSPDLIEHLDGLGVSEQDGIAQMMKEIKGGYKAKGEKVLQENGKTKTIKYFELAGDNPKDAEVAWRAYQDVAEQMGFTIEDAVLKDGKMRAVITKNPRPSAISVFEDWIRAPFYREQLQKNYIEQFGRMANDTEMDDYINKVVSEAEKYNAVKSGESAVRGNEKTFFALDISGNCPWRKAGTPCVYCYVETPRSKQLAGEKLMMSPNKTYDTADYADEILHMPDEMVAHLNNMGGLRVFSIGDFRREDTDALLKVALQAKKRGLDLKMITKQPDTLDLFFGEGLLMPDGSRLKLEDALRSASMNPFDPEGSAKMRDLIAELSKDADGNIVPLKLDNIRVNISTDFDPRFSGAVAEQAYTKLAKKNVEWFATKGVPGSEFLNEPLSQDALQVLMDASGKKPTYQETVALQQKLMDQGMTEEAVSELMSLRGKGKEIADTQAKKAAEALKLEYGVNYDGEFINTAHGKFSFGFPMDQAIEWRKKGDGRIAIRYVAANPLEASFALVSKTDGVDDFDVVTMYHGPTDPDLMMNIMKAQNPALAGMDPKNTKRFLAKMQEIGIPKQIDRSKSLAQSGVNVGSVREIMLDAIAEAFPANKADIEEYKAFLKKHDLMDANLSDRTMNRKKFNSILTENFPDEKERGKARRIMQAINDGTFKGTAEEAKPYERLLKKAGIYKKDLSEQTAGRKAYDKALLEEFPGSKNKRRAELRKKFHNVENNIDASLPAAGGDYSPENVNIAEFLWAYSHANNLTPVKFADGDLIEYADQMFNTIAENKKLMDSPEGLRGLSAIYQSVKPEDFTNLLKNGTPEALTKLQGQLDKVADEAGLGRINLDEVLDAAVSKLCCQTGRCGSCPVKCGFARLTRQDKAIIFGKSLDKELRASVEFDAAGRVILRSFKGGASTGTNIADIAHEVGHIWRRELKTEDLAVASKYVGAKNPLEWTTEQEEKFAKAFEVYLREGNPPSPELGNVFEAFKNWFKQIYKTLKGDMDVELDDDIRKLFDKLTAGMPTDAILPPTGAQPSFGHAVAKNGAGVNALMENVIQGLTDNWDKMKTGQPARWTPAQEAALKKWGDEASRRMVDAKAMSMNVADAARKFTLLDYNDRRNLDVGLAMVFPYHYWYDRTYVNWMKRIVSNPYILASYARYRGTLEKVHAGAPDWWKYNVSSNELLGLDWENPLYFNLEATINPLNGILGADFDDPDRQNGWFASTVDELGKFGPNVWTPIQLAIAGTQALSGNPQAASAWAGRLIPQTQTIKNVTALAGLQGSGSVVTPAGLELDPIMIAQGGMSKYDEARVGRAMASMMKSGQYTEDQLIDAAYQKSGPIWDEAVRWSVVDPTQPLYASRAAGGVASGFLGVGFKGRTPADMLIDTFYAEKNALQARRPDMKPEEYTRAWGTLRERFPFMDTLLLSRKQTSDREEALAYNVISRIPPGMKTDFYKAANIDPRLMDKFYAEKGNLAKWNKADHDTFMAGILNLGAVVATPPTTQRHEWTETSARYGQMMDQAEQLFGKDINDKVDAYYGLKENRGQAERYLGNHPELAQFFDWKGQVVQNDPLLGKYYGGVDFIESYMRTQIMAQATQKFGADIYLKAAQYTDISKAGGNTKGFLADHPEVREFWNFRDAEEAKIPAALQKAAQLFPESGQAYIRPDAKLDSIGAQDIIKSMQQSAGQDPNYDATVAAYTSGSYGQGTGGDFNLTNYLETEGQKYWPGVIEKENQYNRLRATSPKLAIQYLQSNQDLAQYETWKKQKTASYNAAAKGQAQMRPSMQDWQSLLGPETLRLIMDLQQDEEVPAVLAQKIEKVTGLPADMVIAQVLASTQNG